MRYATVNPANTTAISLVDINDVPLIDGRDVRIPDWSGGERAFTIARAEEAWGLYALQESPVTCEPAAYYERHPTGYSYALSGPVGQAGSIVVETRVCVEIPIADLYELKRRDIASQDQLVRYNAVDTSLATNWWMVATQSARNELNGIQGNWLQRQIDGQGWPGGVNQPWVGIYNVSTEVLRREQVDTDTAWETLYLELTQHDQQTGNATDASISALDAAYGDGSQSNFAAVAAHDPADPAWGYPPTVQLPPSTP